MTFAAIKEHVREMTHTDSASLPDSVFDAWNKDVASELTVKLESNDRHDFFNVTTASNVNPFYVGTDNGTVYEVYAENGDLRYPLRNASRQTVIEYLRRSGDPIFYHQEGDKITIAPFSNGLVIRGRWQQPFLQFTGTSVQYTAYNVYPQMYHYAFMKRAFMYLQDYESAGIYSQMLDTEINQINMREKRIAAGASRETRGAWQWA